MSQDGIFQVARCFHVILFLSMAVALAQSRIPPPQSLGGIVKCMLLVTLWVTVLDLILMSACLAFFQSARVQAYILSIAPLKKGASI
jgi:hypothetical protein